MYKDLIAGSSDESEYGDEGNDEERDEKHIEEMRRKLLGGLKSTDSFGGIRRSNKDI
jgi:hypothetical protein